MKKRSLFVATAMLLVAVLVATGATYAWFTSVSKATTNISMSVQNGDSLEISAVGGTAGEWSSVLSTDDFESLRGDIWGDYSTVNGADFFVDDYENDEEKADPDAFVKDQGSVASATIYFRSTKAGSVNVSTTLAVANDNLLKTLRMSTGNKIFANDIYTYNGVAAAGKPTDDGVFASVTTKAATTPEVVVTFDGEKAVDGYYYAQATFYFWVEGTQCNNGMLNNVTNATADLTFNFVAA